jgi:hypothetical protein
MSEHLPNDADGDALRRLRATGSDLSRDMEIDFAVDIRYHRLPLGRHTYPHLPSAFHRVGGADILVCHRFLPFGDGGRWAVSAVW